MPVPSQGHYGFHSFPLLTDFVCLYNYEFGLFSLCKIVRSSVILLLPLQLFFSVLFSILSTIVCDFVHLYLITASDYPFDIFKLSSN